MRRNMAASLIEYGVVRTTEPKAKELRPFVERLITLAKKDTLHARRRVITLLQDRPMIDADGEFKEHETVVRKLFNEIAPRYADRPGGYTRIIRLAERRIGDAAGQVVLQLVEERPPARQGTPGSSRRRKRAAKRREALRAALGKGARAAPGPPAEEPEPAPEQTPEEAADEQADAGGGDE